MKILTLFLALILSSPLFAQNPQYRAERFIASESPWADVTSPTYGGKGDAGTTDNAAAIQAAYDASKGVVFLPQGDFYVDSTINCNRSGITFLGSGPYNATNGTGTRIRGNLASGHVFNCTEPTYFKDITIYASDDSDYLIYLDGAPRSLFENVELRGPAAATTVSLVYSVNSWITKFVNTQFNGGVYAYVDGGSSNAVSFRGGDIQNSKGIRLGYGASNSNGIIIEDAAIEGCLTGAYCIDAGQKVYGLRVHKSYFEDNVGGSIYLDCYGSTIEDNIFNDSGVLESDKYQIEVASTNRVPPQIGGNNFNAILNNMKLSAPVKFSKDNYVSGTNNPMSIIASSKITGSWGPNLFIDPDMVNLTSTYKWPSTTHLTVSKETTTVRLNKTSAKIIIAGDTTEETRWDVETWQLSRLKGKYITVGVWAKSADGRIRLELVDDAGSQITDIGAHSSDDTWRLVQSVKFQVNSAATYLRLYLYLTADDGSDATAYVADPFIYIDQIGSGQSARQPLYDFSEPVYRECSTTDCLTMNLYDLYVRDNAYIGSGKSISGLGDLYIKDSSANAVMSIGTNTAFASQSGQLRFSTNGSQRMVIENDGDVGIGTGTPATKLQVAGIGTFEYLRLGADASAAGTLRFYNATSGSILLQPTTGALGTSVITIPAETGTACVKKAATALSESSDIVTLDYSTQTNACKPKFTLTPTDDDDGFTLGALSGCTAHYEGLIFITNPGATEAITYNATYWQRPGVIGSDGAALSTGASELTILGFVCDSATHARIVSIIRDTDP